MEKHLAIISGQQVLDVLVQPGSTTADVRARLGLPNEFMLSRRDGLPFGERREAKGNEALPGIERKDGLGRAGDLRDVPERDRHVAGEDAFDALVGNKLRGMTRKKNIFPLSSLPYSIVRFKV